MSRKHNHEQPPNQQLRARAKAKLARTAPIDEGLSLQDTGKLLHELQIHQIELEMQNEELQQAHSALEIARDRYIDLYEFAPVGYLTLSASTGMIVDINLTGVALLGVERTKLINRRFANYIVDEDKNRWHQHFLQPKQLGDKRTMELTLLRSDNTCFAAYLDCLTIEANDGFLMLRITLTDITQRKLAEQQLRIAAIVFESQQGIIVTDANHSILAVNRTFTEITGYTADEVIGKNPRLLQSGHHDADFYTAMWESIHHTGVWKGEIWNQRKNGEIYPEYVNITAVEDSKGVITHYVATFSDITLSKLATDEIEHLAFHDSLTGLPNRRLLLDRLEQALASSSHSGKYGALLFIDLDNFKMLNDTLGHNMGDLLLQQVAKRLVDCVREDDTIARLSGDEFIVMLENLHEHEFEAAAQTEMVGEKILARLNQPYQLPSYNYRNTPSIGATLFKNHVHNIEDLLRQADIAMYQAKAAGRNTLRFFDPQMQANINARIALEADLHIALAENQFKLYYQLQTTHDNHAIGAEVLIRWHHPLRGLVSPAEFIPLAEETGLILPIGLWVLKTTCAQLKLWENNPQFQHLQLAINVSAKQFQQVDFVEQITAVLQCNALKPNRLKLELTESVVIDDIKDAIHKMNALRKIGLRFSMDDFGTGYSSLAYLTQLPLDQLKIDQSFIHNIGIRPADSVIVQTIIGMAHNLGVDVIAEGVETEAQRAFLEQHGCLSCQGYLFSKPVPIEEFELLLTRSG
jgi:diguanylate cyclase (GGDEF)-like protein/PAS domain S-box-containing protein